MPATKSLEPKDLIFGGLLQCIEAGTVGLPFEVWKTHMGANRSEGTLQALRSIHKSGGWRAFYRGFNPKMVESFLKGGVLMFSKEGIIRASKKGGLSDTASGFLGGFGGGMSQVVIMGPCTYLVTASVTQGASIADVMKQTLKTKGVAGFYSGGSALLLRQGTNWASRQGFTDAIRMQVKRVRGKDKLSVGDEVLCGTLGGMLSTWNQVEIMTVFETSSSHFCIFLCFNFASISSISRQFQFCIHQINNFFTSLALTLFWCPP
jgi:hypothetical protein